MHPECIYDFDATSGILRLRKQDPTIRWFDRNKYAIDGLDSIVWTAKLSDNYVYRKDMRQPGSKSELIEGYGAYGLSMHPTFTPSVVSLLDRGFIHAIAHIRGGREKGDRWYREGRLLNKRNTFTDFIAATETLIAQGYANGQSVFAQGGSAGGLVVYR